MRERSWVPGLLGLWLAAFAGLLAFLYMFFIGFDIGGESMFQVVFR